MAPFCLLAGSVRLSAVYFLGSLWDHFGIVLGSFWGFFFFCPFWAILPIFWPTLGPFLRSFCVFFFLLMFGAKSSKTDVREGKNMQISAKMMQICAKRCPFSPVKHVFCFKTRHNRRFNWIQTWLGLRNKNMFPPPTLDLNRRSNKSVQ